MEELILIVFQIGLEILWQVIIEVLAEFGLASVKVAFDRPNRNLPVAVVGLLLLGAGVGGLSLLVWPGRLVGSGPIPGLSLVVAPLCTGVALRAWGAFRRANGHVTTHLATFPGGAAFALGTALVRFVWAA